MKHQREGEFVLPEDISDEMVYTFPQFDSEFTINLNLSTSEDVEDVDVVGDVCVERVRLSHRGRSSPKSIPWRCVGRRVGCCWQGARGRGWLWR